MNYAPPYIGDHWQNVAAKNGCFAGISHCKKIAINLKSQFKD